MTKRSPDLIVTVLGSGTCVPSLDRSASALLIETGGTRILIDCGPGTQHRLLEAGRSHFDLTHIFLTHLHPDHSGELTTLLFATKYPDVTRRRTALTVAGAAGLKPFYRKLSDAYGDWISLPPERFSLVELSADGNAELILAPGVTIRSAPVVHTPMSLAYRVTGPKGASVVCSGDTDVCESLVDLARGADLFICESALPEGMKVDGHLTPALAGEMAARAGVGRLMLTHFYPECDGEDLVGQCRRAYDGEVILAADLLRLELP